MTLPWQKNSQIDDITKSTVTGWIRREEKTINLWLIIPTMIYYLITLFVYNDEMFDQQCTKIQLSTNKKCIKLKKGSFSNTGYGLNLICVNKDCIFKYKWDIKITKNKITRKQNLIGLPFIFIGLSSDYIPDTKYNKLDLIQYKYSSDGEIFVNGQDIPWKKYGQKFGYNDIVSVLLDMSRMTVHFAVNGKDQPIAYKNIDKQSYRNKKLRLTIKMNDPYMSVEIHKFVRFK